VDDLGGRLEQALPLHFINSEKTILYFLLRRIKLKFDLLHVVWALEHFGLLASLPKSRQSRRILVLLRTHVKRDGDHRVRN